MHAPTQVQDTLCLTFLQKLFHREKNEKVAGCDNTPPEAIKAEGDTSEEVFLDLCNRIWGEKKIPEEWKKGLLIKLRKKGDLGYCKT